MIQPETGGEEMTLFFVNRLVGWFLAVRSGKSPTGFSGGKRQADGPAKRHGELLP